MVNSQTVSFPNFIFFNQIEEEWKSVALNGSLVDQIVAFTLINDFSKNWSTIKQINKQFYERYRNCEVIIRLLPIRGVPDFVAKQLFINAVEINSLNSVQKLLSLTVVTKKHGNQLLSSIIEYTPALKTACVKGYKEIVQYFIIDRRIDPSSISYPDKAVLSPYSLESSCLSAVQGNQIEIVKLLWERGSYKALDNVQAAFCQACHLKHIEIAQFFLELNPQWRRDQEPLLSALKNDPEIVESLLLTRSLS